MSDDEVVNASMQRVNADTEKLTRRNMKECVAEFIQTKCLEDIAFARLTMHPRKSMIHCFQYISRKAWDYIQDELKASGIQPGRADKGMAVMFRTICATSGQRTISATQTPKRTMRKKKSLYRTPTMEKISPEPPKRSRRKRKRQKPNRSLCRRKSLPTMVSCRCWISAWQRQVKGVQHDCI